MFVPGAAASQTAALAWGVLAFYGLVIVVFAITAVVDWLHHVDATFSTYKVESPISRLGMGLATLDEMPAEVIEVLALCEGLYHDTDGAFDALVVPARTAACSTPRVW